MAFEAGLDKLPEALLPQAEMQSEFARLLAKPVQSRSLDFERLLSKPVGSTESADFLRLLEQDYKPATATRGAVGIPPERLTKLKGYGGALGGLVTAVGLELLLEVLKQNQELGTNPKWLDWVLDHAISTENKSERDRAKRKNCDCCEKIAKIAMQHVKAVEKHLKQKALPSRDSAKRFLRNELSRRNA